MILPFRSELARLIRRYRCEKLQWLQVDAPSFQRINEREVPSAFSNRLHGLIFLLFLKKSFLDHSWGLVAREHDKSVLITDDNIAGTHSHSPH